MQSAMNEKDSRVLLDRLKQDLKELPEGTGYLDAGLESAAKHIPAYLRIIKGHIEQLAKVLELETHDHRKLENVGLASPVVQLMQLFRELNNDDIQLLETLAYEARHWQSDTVAVHIPKEATAA
jgi:hypothetical protein